MIKFAFSPVALSDKGITVDFVPFDSVTWDYQQSGAGRAMVSLDYSRITVISMVNADDTHPVFTLSDICNAVSAARDADEN